MYRPDYESANISSFDSRCYSNAFPLCSTGYMISLGVSMVFFHNRVKPKEIANSHSCATISPNYSLLAVTVWDLLIRWPDDQRATRSAWSVQMTVHLYDHTLPLSNKSGWRLSGLQFPSYFSKITWIPAILIRSFSATNPKNTDHKSNHLSQTFIFFKVLVYLASTFDLRQLIHF